MNFDINIFILIQVLYSRVECEVKSNSNQLVEVKTSTCSYHHDNNKRSPRIFNDTEPKYVHNTQTTNITSVKLLNKIMSPNQSQANYSMYEAHADSDTPAINLELIVSLVIGILYSITFLVGIVGNSLVVSIILINKKMRSSTNILILSLAIADLLFVIVCIPFTGFNYTTWYFGDFWCKIVQYTSNATVYVSVYLLVLMSVDRYLAIAYPMTSKLYRTQRNAVICVLVLSALILVANIPHLFLFLNYSYTYDSIEHNRCILEYNVIRVKASQNPSPANMDLLNHVEYKIRVYHLCFFLFAYALPLMLLFIIYCLILFKLGQNKGKGVGKTKNKVTLMVITVVSCFVICWTPLQIMMCLQHVFGIEFDSIQIIILIVTNSIAYLNSCMNPIIYGFSNAEFKK
jgi:allatostatin receptor